MVSTSYSYITDTNGTVYLSNSPIRDLISCELLCLCNGRLHLTKYSELYISFTGVKSFREPGVYWSAALACSSICREEKMNWKTTFKTGCSFFKSFIYHKFLFTIKVMGLLRGLYPFVSVILYLTPLVRVLLAIMKWYEFLLLFIFPNILCFCAYYFLLFLSTFPWDIQLALSFSDPS